MEESNLKLSFLLALLPVGMWTEMHPAVPPDFWSLSRSLL